MVTIRTVGDSTLTAYSPDAPGEQEHNVNRNELIDENGNLTAAARAMIETNARAFTDAFLVNSIARTQSAEARDLYQTELDRRWTERLAD